MSRIASSLSCASRLRRGSLLLLLPFLLGSPLSLQAELPIGSGSAATPTIAMASTEHLAVWRYTVRPGDILPQLAEDMLKPGKSWLDLIHYNKLPNAAAAVAGSTLQIPVQWLKRQPKPARVTAVTGSVVHRSQGDNRSRPLRDDVVLHVGDQVQTLDGRVTIGLADGSTIRLEPRSVLVFDRMTQFGKSGMVDTRLRLERGSLGTQVQPLSQDGSRFQIETPSAVAAVRGTAFRLSTEPDLTRLEVTEGQVAFGNTRQQQLVNAGFAAELGRSGTIRRMALPPAPQLAAVPANVDELPVKVSWQRLPGVAGYRINLINRDSGAWLASQQTTALSRALGNLDNGNYTLEVAAVSPGDLTGQSATADFSIGLQAKPAVLELPSADASLGEDELLQFSWSFQGASEVGQIEVSRRPSFNNVIASSGWSADNQGTLDRSLSPGQYYWRVVTEAGGSSVATSTARALTIEGALNPPEIININYVDNQVRIFWRDVPMADGYLLQLAQDPDFDSVIKEAEIDENTAALRLAPGQRYFVRLRGLTEGPLESSWGPGRELYVE
jgi:hypothetical protein